MRNPGFVADGHDLLNHIHTVFLHRVVAAVACVGAASIVIDGESSPYVEQPHGSSFLDQSRVEPCRFGSSQTNVVDVGDLGSEMVMEEFQAIKHSFAPQQVDHLDDLCGVQTKRTAVTTAVGPMSTGYRRGLHPQSDVGLDSQLFGPFQNHSGFSRHFDDQYRTKTQLQPPQGEIDIFLILVAIADDVGFGIVSHRRGRR